MKPLTLIHDLSLRDLQTIAASSVEPPVTDLDFLETLAARRCILVPPWVLRLQPDGGMERVTAIAYDPDLNLDKRQILRSVLKQVPKETAARRHGTHAARR